MDETNSTEIPETVTVSRVVIRLEGSMPGTDKYVRGLSGGTYDFNWSPAVAAHIYRGRLFDVSDKVDAHDFNKIATDLFNTQQDFDRPYPEFVTVDVPAEDVAEETRSRRGMLSPSVADFITRKYGHLGLTPQHFAGMIGSGANGALRGEDVDRYVEGMAQPQTPAVERYYPENTRTATGLSLEDFKKARQGEPVKAATPAPAPTLPAPSNEEIAQSIEDSKKPLVAPTTHS